MMICREVPLSTLRREAELLLHEQETEAARHFAQGAMAALQWVADPVNNLPPHQTLLVAAKAVTLQ